MAKRPFSATKDESNHNKADEDAARHKKQRKAPAKVNHQQNVTSEEIRSAQQLQRLLTDYANATKIQHGIQSLKLFLTKCRVSEEVDESSVEKNLEILLAYLDNQSGTTSSGTEESCKDILLAWSYANQSNNFQLLSTIPTLLASLLKTISPAPAFQKNGIRLCKAVLQQNFLKIFYRSLTGNRDGITAPCLRLLTEVNKFDNGSLCDLLQQSFDFTVKDISRNLEPKRGINPQQIVTEDPARPSVRTTFVRFILSFLQNGSTNTKSEILGLRAFVTPLFKHIKSDSAIVLKELFQIFSSSVVDDEKLARNTKSSFFSEWALSRIADLYSREDSVDTNEDEKPISQLAHNFLRRLCTLHGSGVCFKDAGWYMPGTAKTSKDSGDSRAPRVFNRALSSFLRYLRPHADTLQAELVIDILKTCPELVADYFTSDSSFNFDPKLTSTWTGYASFLTDVVELDVPDNFGWSESHQPNSSPPPTNIVIENIIPKPLTKSVLTSCLQHKVPFVRFISIRLMNATFSKLSKVLDALDNKAVALVDSGVWEKSHFDLIEEFSTRMPDAAVLLTLFKNSSDNESLSREAITKLLKNYYNLLPEIVSGHRLDLTGVLSRYMTKDISTTDGMDTLELKNIISAVRDFSDLKWWSKTSSLPYSPFTCVLKLYVQADSTASSRDLMEVLTSVANPVQIFQSETVVSPIEALAQSLAKYKDHEGFDLCLTFFDDCASRCVRTPFKYLDAYAEMVQRLNQLQTHSEGIIYVAPVSPIFMTMSEQWSFLLSAQSMQEAKMQDVATWFAQFVQYCCHLGENVDILKDLTKGMAQGGEIMPKCCEILQDGVSSIERWADSEIVFDNSEEIKTTAGCITDAIDRDTVYVSRLEAVDATSTSLLDVTILQKAILQSASVCAKSDDTSQNHGLTALEMLFQKVVAYHLQIDKAVLRLLTNNVDWIERLFILPDVPYNLCRLIKVFKLMVLSIKDVEDDQLVQSSMTTRFVKFVHIIGEKIKDLDKDTTDSFSELCEVYVSILPDGQSTLDVLEALKTLPSDTAYLSLLDRILNLNMHITQGILKEDSESVLSRASTNDKLCNNLIKSVKHSPDFVIGDRSLKVVKKLVCGGQSQRNLAELILKDADILRSASDLLSSESNDIEQSSSILSFVLSQLTKRNSERTIVWKGSITEDVISKIEACLIKLKHELDNNEEALVDLPWRPHFMSLTEKVIYLFDHEDVRSYMILYETSQDHKLSPEFVGIMEAISNTAQNMDLVSTLCSTFVLSLTRAFSAPGDDLSSTNLSCVKELGTFLKLSNINIGQLIARPRLNAFIEAGLVDRINVVEVVEILDIVISKLSAKQVDFSKFLQQILSSDKSPLKTRSYTTVPGKECVHLASIIKHLFGFAKIAQSNISTLDGMLVLYRGTNHKIDKTLLEYIVFIEGHLARSCAARITTFTFVEGDADDQLVSRDSHGRLELTLYSKMVTRSLRYNVGRAFATSTAEEDGEVDDEDGVDYKTYDLSFFLPIVAHCMVSGEQAFSVQTLLEKQCVGLAIMGLASQNGEIRGMAESFLLAVVAKLESSNYRDRTQTTHLLCIILASLHDGVIDIKNTPIPCTTAAFLASSLHVLCNPSHFLYEKIMSMLLKRPYLDLQDIPLLQSLMLSELDYQKEASWILTVLNTGLHNTNDLMLFHRRRVFEQCMSMYSQPFDNEKIREKIVELLWRAAGVEGGASTLITRHAVLAWVQQKIDDVAAGGGEGQEGVLRKNRVMLKRLAARLYEGSAKEHVKSWSKGNVGRVLERVVVS